MRVAWFTPLSQRSAIGEFSVHVASALAERVDVQLWTSDTEPLHASDLEVIRYSAGSESLELLRDSDVLVYNLGDYLPFHRDVHLVSRTHPGVVILHDRVLHHLYAGLWLTGERPDRERYAERMRCYYGREGAEVAAASLEGQRLPVWESDEETLRYPLFEEGIRGATGVVTHSVEQAAQVRSRWFGPVAALHLPCYRDVLERARSSASRMPRSPSGRVELLTVGHVNPNKQVHRVVKMLAADSDLAASARYRIVGPESGFRRYVEELRDLIAAHPEVQVELLGWRSETELHELMTEADVFVNLRHPVMEGGSASVMRQLAYGRPVLCFESGLFSELPSEALVCAPAGDFEVAAQALRRLVGDQSERAEIGARARSVAEAYDERRYIDGLLALLEESRRAAPALRFLDSVARELGSMRVEQSLATYDEIADDFSRILAL